MLLSGANIVAKGVDEQELARAALSHGEHTTGQKDRTGNAEQVNTFAGRYVRERPFRNRAGCAAVT